MPIIKKSTIKKIAASVWIYFYYNFKTESWWDKKESWWDKKESWWSKSKSEGWDHIILIGGLERKNKTVNIHVK